MPEILLVEDQTLLGVYIALTLLDDGYEVERVLVPELVEAPLLAVRPSLIVFNTRLPAAEKANFIVVWRRLAPVVKILEVSENPMTGIRGSKLLSEPDASLAIPFQFPHLTEVVAETLRR